MKKNLSQLNKAELKEYCKELLEENEDLQNQLDDTNDYWADYERTTCDELNKLRKQTSINIIDLLNRMKTDFESELVTKFENYIEEYERFYK